MLQKQDTGKKPSGQKCIVLAEGYYEWKKNGSKKTPYYVYPSKDVIPDASFTNIKQEKDLETTKEETTKDLKIKKKALLFFAGLMNYDSVTIVTKEANSDMDWLHSRVPVMLKSPEAVNEWLESEPEDISVITRVVDYEQNQKKQNVLSQEKDKQFFDKIDYILQTKDYLKWHEVTASVGSVKNDGEYLIRAVTNSTINAEKKRKEPSDNKITSFFSVKKMK